MYKKTPWIVFLCLMFIAVYCTGESYFDGKSTTSRSLEEIIAVFRHFHNPERWFGVAVSPSGITNGGDSDVMAPYVPDAGNDTWGAWVLLLGTADTPILAGSTVFDPHRLFITAAERSTSIHRIQVAWHATSATLALAAGDYTETMFKPEGAAFTSVPIPIRLPDQDVGITIWMRIWAAGQNTGTLNTFMGVHEYPN